MCLDVFHTSKKLFGGLVVSLNEYQAATSDGLRLLGVLHATILKTTIWYLCEGSVAVEFTYAEYARPNILGRVPWRMFTSETL